MTAFPLRRLRWPLIVAVLASLLYVGIRTKRKTLVDFEVYRTAATRALAAEPLYRPEDGHYQYKYLPAFAFPMVPFAEAPHEIATGIWYALSVFLLYYFVAQSVRLLPERRLSLRLLLWLVVIITAKFWVKELVMGQTNVLLGVVLISALVAARRGRWRLAGALVGLGTFVKPYAMLLLPWLAVVGGLQAALAASTVIVFGLVAPAAVYGWHGNLALVAEWYRTVTSTTAPNLLDAENVSLAAMWAKWIGPGPNASALALATSLAALAPAGVAVAMRRRVSEPLYLEFGLLMLLVPLLSPQGWDYVLIVGMPAFVCLLDRWGDVTLPWRVLTAAGIALVSFTIFDLLGRALYLRTMLLSVVTVGALLLVVCAAHLRSRSLA
jgi:hypothetical protein